MGSPVALTNNQTPLKESEIASLPSNPANDNAGVLPQVRTSVCFIHILVFTHAVPAHTNTIFFCSALAIVGTYGLGSENMPEPCAIQTHAAQQDSNNSVSKGKVNMLLFVAINSLSIDCVPSALKPTDVMQDNRTSTSKSAPYVQQVDLCLQLSS